MRSTSRDARKPPQPSGKRKDTTPHWVTLREAEAATSVPVNTLRKWVRKADLPSYLESDGDIAVRFVDLDAVIDRANDLGRVVEPMTQQTEEQEPVADDTDMESDSASLSRPETMIVPVDAWNKMLTQLGNLHEAGQQLAEARERAVKAETEASFLRERLSELRTAPTSHQPDPQVADREEAERTLQVVLHEEQRDDETVAQPDNESLVDQETTTYWRYLTRGWRDRKRRMASHPDP